MSSFNQLSALAAKILSLVVLSFVISACGGSSGGSGNTQTPSVDNGDDTASSSPEAINYNGPPPRDDTVNRYRTNVWSNLILEAGCGDCHTAGGTSPFFARTDDINAAYDAAASLLNTSNAVNFVDKVGEPHNCWLTNTPNCVNVMAGWVNNFNNSSEGGTTFLDALNLQEPALRMIGDSKQFPADATGTNYSTTVYTIVNENCGSCHTPDPAGQIQQQPYIAGNASDHTTLTSDDLEVSYEAIQSRINLDDENASLEEAVSRLVVRLRDESHNCWTGSCESDAITMHNAIISLAGSITPTSVDPDFIVSGALSAEDFQVAASGGRIETNVIAKWEFRDGEDATVAEDTSGVSPRIPLTVRGNVDFLASGGVRINDGKLQGFTEDSEKLHTYLTASGEFSVEAWVVPLNVTQDGPARIVTYSGDSDSHNFMLGQNTYDYEFQVRSSATGTADGTPALSTPSAEEVLQATLQHVVMTYSAVDGRRIYVNGELVAENDAQGGGNFSSWDRNFVLAVGDEVSDDNQWQGTIRYLAIHDAALSLQDIETNYDIGVGQKYYLLFNISAHVPVVRSYIVMEVEELDDYGYLFNTPFFVTFDDDASITSFPIQGMRIGINGQEAEVGQAYANLDLEVTQLDVDGDNGRQVLSRVGTVIAVDQGRDNDQFFLTFEQLGNSSYARVEGTPSPQPQVADNDTEQSDIGIKTFDEINEALSALTGISKTDSEIAASYSELKQQLPTDPDINGFSASQQIAVTQLAVLYCKALVDQESALSSSNFFPGFNFSASNPTTAFDAAGRDLIISPLLDQLLANTIQVEDQVNPSGPNEARSRLDTLITDLLANCSDDSCVPQNPDGDTNTRVESIVLATCATAFGSAMMLIQ